MQSEALKMKQQVLHRHGFLSAFCVSGIFFPSYLVPPVKPKHPQDPQLPKVIMPFNTQIMVFSLTTPNLAIRKAWL